MTSLDSLSAPARTKASFSRMKRAGFTLLELMLVLTIVAAIGAVAVPFIGGAFERQKLVGAVETLRLQWDEARVKAMRTGQAQVFTCQLGTNTYAIKPLVLQSDTQNVGVGATLATTGGMVETANTGNGTVAVAADTSNGTDRQLEDKLSFVSCVAVSDMRAYVVAQESQMSSNGALNTQTVASSIVFYPDGSTSTAEIRVQNERGSVRALQLRGLTGHARVVELPNVPVDSK